MYAPADRYDERSCQPILHHGCHCMHMDTNMAWLPQHGSALHILRPAPLRRCAALMRPWAAARTTQ